MKSVDSQKLKSKAMSQTAGRWWSPEGFVEGVYHHDTTVQSVEIKAQLEPCPIFLPTPVDLHVHGGGGHDCMSGEAAIRGTLQTHARHGTWVPVSNIGHCTVYGH